ncbi:hypothetical protein H4219_002713 [Mycoemilia scoparia]|uniref:Chitin synthase export chaperone n=1 Tax=Mycoemilia scoparia TaxID=417184 RepID=A0A9W8DTN8_9FUNG|nr:hypothetical protein H4219_002713 [Mycoemilia scoparia]
MKFGDFESLCRLTNLPVCTLFVGNDSSLLSDHPKCKLNSYDAGSAYIVDLSDLVVTAVAILLAAYCVIKTHEKLAAVETVNKWLGAVNVALTVSFFWMLMLAGFVGFQLLPDGSAFSLFSILISTIIVLVGIGYIAADTAFGVTDTLKPKADRPFYSPGLFFVYLIFPIISIALYLCAQLVIVFRFLAVRKPLLWLLGALVLFVLSQIFMLVISDEICNGTNGRIDGTMFSTLLNFGSLVMIYFFWNSITEGDGDEYFDDPIDKHNP